MLCHSWLIEASSGKISAQSKIFANSRLFSSGRHRAEQPQAPGWTSGDSSREQSPGIQMREYVRSTIYYSVGRTYYSITGTTSTAFYLGTKGWWYSLQVLMQLATSYNHRHDHTAYTRHKWFHTGASCCFSHSCAQQSYLYDTTFHKSAALQMQVLEAWCLICLGIFDAIVGDEINDVDHVIECIMSIGKIAQSP